MEEKRRLIVWNTSALDCLADELENIAHSSYSRAERVEQAISFAMNLKLTKIAIFIVMPTIL